MRTAGSLFRIKLKEHMKKAYLTIDDSPSSDWQEKLDFLVEKNIQTLWFCTGENLEKHPAFVAEAIAVVHVIGNHSFSHPDFSLISEEQARQEIGQTESIITELVGDVPNPRWFRFPYGRRGDTDETKSEPERAEKRQALQSMLRDYGYGVPELPGVTYEVIQEYRKQGEHDWWWTFDCKEWALDPAFREAHGLFNLESLLKRMDTDHFRKVTDFVGLNLSNTEEVVLIHDHAHSTHLFRPLIEGLIDKDICFTALPV